VRLENVSNTDGLLIENILGTQARGSTGTILPRNFEEGNVGTLNGWPGKMFIMH
jgi:hypothetical protein